MTITSRQNPLVARFRAARSGGEELLLDGAHLIADALAARVSLRTVAVTSSGAGRADVAALLEGVARGGAEIAVVAPMVMDAISPLRSSSAIVALAGRPVQARERIFAGRLAVVAIDVQDPGNVGAIVRVAEAGGASGVFAAGSCADPFGWKSLRGSMGSALRLPVVADVDVDTVVQDLRDRGFRIVATVPRHGRSPGATPLTGAVALLIGGEGHGLDDALVASADDRVTIPMEAPVESLNAAVTAALLIYEARRQAEANLQSEV